MTRNHGSVGVDREITCPLQVTQINVAGGHMAIAGTCTPRHISLPLRPAEHVVLDGGVILGLAAAEQLKAMAARAALEHMSKTQPEQCAIRHRGRE